MKFILNKDTLEIENIEVVKSGSVNYYEADVEYDESWNDLVIEAVMIKKDDDVGKSIAVINNKMYIDQKLRGTYCIGFVGYKLEEEKKIYQVSTNLQKVYFDLGAGEIETENVEAPTPTEWEIYNAQVQAFITEANRLDIDAVEENGGAIITITKKDGTTKEVKVEKGDKGDAGSIKFIIVNELPTENIDESAMYLKPSTNPLEENTYEEYVYINGAWESLGSAKVEVDLTNYVKNTDYASKNTFGLVKIGQGLKVDANNKLLYTDFATQSIIDKKENYYYTVITPAFLDYAVKSGMSANKLEWTEEEKASARNLIGASTDVVLTQAEYDALVEAGTVDETVFYYITEE